MKVPLLNKITTLLGSNTVIHTPYLYIESFPQVSQQFPHLLVYVPYNSLRYSQVIPI